MRKVFISIVIGVVIVGGAAAAYIGLHHSSTNSGDTTAPQIAITSPTDQTRADQSVNVMVSASDNSGIEKVEYYLDHKFAGVSYLSPYDLKLDTSKLPSGAHEVQAKAYDKAGNTTLSNSVIIMVGIASPVSSSTPTPTPTPSATSVPVPGQTPAPTHAPIRTSTPTPAATPTPTPTPSSGPTPDTTAPTVPTGLSLSADSGGNVDASWTASTDNVGVTGYDIWRDGVALGTSSTASYHDATVVAGHTYNYKVRAFDAAGNHSDFTAEVPIALAAPNNWPDATNTGVPSGTTLTSISTISVNTPGTVINGMDIADGISIHADNVVIENSIIHGEIVNHFQLGTVIHDVEVIGPGTDDNTNRVPLVGSGGYTCIRCNLHDGNSGFEVNDDTTIQDSYVHDIGPDSDVHKTAIGSNGSVRDVIRHNNLDCAVAGCSAALSVYGDFAQPDQWVIDNNLFNTTGSYCVYAGSEAAKVFPIGINIQFTNNHFGRKYSSTCGQFGPVTAWSAGGGNVWSGNVWDDTGDPVNP